MASKLKIKVNGLVHNVTASLDTPLLYVLHNELHLHGPRFGCGLAQCGACSVLLDGKEIRSCVTPVAAVSGKEITTLEGLPALWAKERGTTAAAPALHPLQQAWIDVQVPHCGYCQNGMMIQAADLLGDDEESDRGSDPHGDERPSLPLWHLSAHPDGDQAGRRRDGEGREVTMTGFMHEQEFSRKTFLKGGGALVVGFSFAGAALAGKASAAGIDPFASTGPGRPDAGRLVGSRSTPTTRRRSRRAGSTRPGLDHGPDADRRRRARHGHRPAPVRRFDTDSARRRRTPATQAAARRSRSGGPLRPRAAAAAKQALLGLASTQPRRAGRELDGEKGVVSGGGKTVTYGQLIGDKLFNVDVSADARRSNTGVAPRSRQPVQAGRHRSARAVRHPGQGQRDDTYVREHPSPGHAARPCRPSRGQGAYGDGTNPVPLSVDANSIKNIPDVQIVHVGNFLAVVAPKEYDAIQAAAQLKVDLVGSAEDLRRRQPLEGHAGFDRRAGAGAVAPARRRRPSRPGQRRHRDGVGGEDVRRNVQAPLPDARADRPERRVADVTKDSAIIYSHVKNGYGDPPAGARRSRPRRLFGGWTYDRAASVSSTTRARARSAAAPRTSTTANALPSARCRRQARSRPVDALGRARLGQLRPGTLWDVRAASTRTASSSPGTPPASAWRPYAKTPSEAMVGQADPDVPVPALPTPPTRERSTTSRTAGSSARPCRPEQLLQGRARCGRRTPRRHLRQRAGRRPARVPGGARTRTSSG